MGAIRLWPIRDAGSGVTALIAAPTCTPADRPAGATLAPPLHARVAPAVAAVLLRVTLNARAAAVGAIGGGVRGLASRRRGREARGDEGGGEQGGADPGQAAASSVRMKVAAGRGAGGASVWRRRGSAPGEAAPGRAGAIRALLRARPLGAASWAAGARMPSTISAPPPGLAARRFSSSRPSRPSRSQATWPGVSCIGLCLPAKRIQRGASPWPATPTGSVVLLPARMPPLLESLERREQEAAADRSRRVRTADALPRARRCRYLARPRASSSPAPRAGSAASSRRR